MPEARESGGPDPRTYECAPDVAWVVETDAIVVVHGGTGAAYSLEYPEAAIWELLGRGYSYERVVSMLPTIASLSSSAAEQRVLHALDAWTEVGLLVGADGHG